MVEYTAFLLSKDMRKQLLSSIPSSYSDIIADHITFQFGVKDFGLLFHPKQIEAYAVIDNHKGLQAIAVTVDGNKFRPDGEPYHITWSLNSSLFKPVDSNSLIQDFLDNKLDDKCIQLLRAPIHISATPVHICGDDNKTRTIRQLPSSPLPPPSPN